MKYERSKALEDEENLQMMNNLANVKTKKKKGKRKNEKKRRKNKS